MSVVSKPPASALSALTPPRRAPTNVGLDLAFVLATAMLVGLAILTKSLFLGVFLAVPILYIVLFILVRRPVWTFAFALIVQHFSGLIKELTNFNQIGYFIQDGTFLIVLVPLILRRVLNGSQPNRSRHAWTAIDTFIVLYIALNLVCAFNPASPSPWLVLAAVRVRLLPLMMYFFVLYITREGVELERPLFFVMATCTLCGAIFGLYESAIGIGGVQRLGPGFWPHQVSRVWQDAHGGEHFRPPGIYSDAGIAVLVAGMFAFMALLRPPMLKSGAAKAFVAVALLLSVVEIVATGSRSGFLAVAAAFIFLALWKRSRVLTAALIGLPVVLGIALLIQPQILDRYATILNPAQAYSQNRGYTNVTMLNELKSQPMGFGTGTATEGAAKVADLLKIDATADSGTTKNDNGWANLLHEMGVAGVLVYLVLLVGIFSMGLRASRLLAPAKAYLAATLVVWTVIAFVSTIGFVITDVFPINVYFWSLLALVVSEGNRRQKALEARRPKAEPKVLATAGGFVPAPVGERR